MHRSAVPIDVSGTRALGSLEQPVPAANTASALEMRPKVFRRGAILQRMLNRWSRPAGAIAEPVQRVGVCASRLLRPEVTGQPLR